MAPGDDDTREKDVGDDDSVAIARPGKSGPGYRVARPWWRPGTAIAAGAAIGFIGAAAAYSWAGQPPAPGYCWYYTDPSQRAGFWDVCP